MIGLALMTGHQTFFSKNDIRLLIFASCTKSNSLLKILHITLDQVTENQ